MDSIDELINEIQNANESFESPLNRTSEYMGQIEVELPQITDLCLAILNRTSSLALVSLP